MRLIIPLTAGYLLDLLVGDPQGWPHPVRLFGWLILRGEAFLNKGRALFLKGAAMTLFLCSLVFIFFWLLCGWLWREQQVLYYIFSSLFVFFGACCFCVIQILHDGFDFMLKYLEIRMENDDLTFQYNFRVIL